MELWNKETEKRFFEEALVNSVESEHLFYAAGERHLAYWPKRYEGKKDTLQARNSLIGKFTEKWVRDLIEEVVKDKNLYAVQGAICESLALSSGSAADVVIAKTPKVRQRAEDILLIAEVKMSVVWNWEYGEAGELNCIGDFTSHSGKPSILRSDSVLKAIGKSMNVRISSDEAKRIPILVIGNTPIRTSYIGKIDKLKRSGILQGFWSLNPEPCDSANKLNIKATRGSGFIRIDSFEELKQRLDNLLNTPFTYFSGMKTTQQIGCMVEQANEENTHEAKGKKFLELLNEETI